MDGSLPFLLAAVPGLFSLKGCLVLSGLIFIIGAWGVLARRNVLIVLICIELMLNAVNLALVAFARAQVNLAGEAGPGRWSGELGQIAALLVIAVAAAEAAIGLAIVITYFRNTVNVDTREMDLLKQ